MTRRAVVVWIAVVVAVLLVGQAAFARYLGRMPWVWSRLRDYRGAFAERTSGAEGLRIFELGAEPRRLRFETADASVARGFLQLVDVDERLSGNGCDCSGEYEVEVLGTFGVKSRFEIKEGGTLHAPDSWPNDAAITLDSADAVCAWLEAHGIHEESPRQRVARLTAESAARDAAQDALLGPGRAKALRAASGDDVAARIAEWAPDATDRIVLAVRFLAIEDPSGRGDGSRARDCVESWLGQVDDPPALTAAFERMLADAELAPIAASRFEATFRGDDERFTASALPALRRRAGHVLLASADEYQRECGAKLLGSEGDVPAAGGAAK